MFSRELKRNIEKKRVNTDFFFFFFFFRKVHLTQLQFRNCKKWINEVIQKQYFNCFFINHTTKNQD